MIIQAIFTKNSQAAKIAWEFSRPLECGKSDINNIIQLDLPVNEFPNFHLQIESTIVEREIIATMRNHVMWAQTSRVQNILAFEISKEFKSDNEYYELIREEMKLESNNKRQDDYRLKLPIISKTKYSIIISARDLIKLYKYFIYLSENIKNNYFKLLFKNSASHIEIFLKTQGYDIKNLSQYKTNKILNEDFLIEKTGKLGNFISASSELPIHLRSQLVRHRNIFIKDNFVNIFSNPNGHKFTLLNKVKCTVVGDSETMYSILSKRSCWIAQYNIWSDILNKIANLIDADPKLPCSGGVCPFHGDALLRFEGKDPNPPCPIHIKYNNLHPTSQQIKEMKFMIEADSRPDFWNKKIEDIQ